MSSSLSAVAAAGAHALSLGGGKLSFPVARWVVKHVEIPKRPLTLQVLVIIAALSGLTPHDCGQRYHIRGLPGCLLRTECISRLVEDAVMRPVDVGDTCVLAFGMDVLLSLVASAVRF